MCIGIKMNKNKSKASNRLAQCESIVEITDNQNIAEMRSHYRRNLTAA